MKDLFLLVAHLLSTVLKLMRPGGARSVVAESLLLKHQLLVLNRGRKRTPPLSPWDRLLLALSFQLITTTRIHKLAVILKPVTLLRFHKLLARKKYQLLFASARRGRPGPKGPSDEIIAAILELKRRNPRFGCPRIALEIGHAFGIEINKDIVRRVLAKYHHNGSDTDGPSWLTCIDHTKIVFGAWISFAANQFC